METGMCVCGHGITCHSTPATDGNTRCVADVHDDTLSARCYCPRFIPAPPPPGALDNEGKKPSLR